MQQSNPLPFGQARFESIRKIGEGGLGRVDEIVIIESAAPDLRVGTHWARKQLSERWDANPSARERFEREINALSRMSHPNIVTCAGQNVPGEKRFYLMPLYDSSIRGVMVPNRREDWRVVAQIGLVVADAMAYAHTAGFIHRDLKPDNILFRKDQAIVIADWGFGYFIHQYSTVMQPLTQGGMGTAYYCSPEQWRTGKCEDTGDIYSLGMTLDELVTGTQRRILPGDGLPDGIRYASDPDAERFASLLHRMTRPDPDARPFSMALVALELRSILNPEPLFLGGW